MTPEIALTLFILLIAVILLVFERLRADLIALLVLLSLALTGLVTPEEAISGFSNPAVITVWAMFILSAGLARTGIASLLGRAILRLGGKKESGLILSLMTVSAALSAFINNVGVVAMLLPVVNHLSRKRKISPSMLLMPLAVGVFLGGVNTLIGTPPNILASNSLNESLGRNFHFFDFLLAGLPVTIAGIAFMVVLGRRFLPKRNLTSQLRYMGGEAGELFELEERLFSLRLPDDSLLAGKPLAESRLGAALKLNVISITHRGKTKLAPSPSTQLHGGDQLLVLGKGDWLKDLIQAQHLTLEEANGLEKEGQRLDVKRLISSQISLVEIVIPKGSSLIGQSLAEAKFRKTYKANVLAIWRGERAVRTNFQDLPLKAGDKLLVQVSRAQHKHLRSSTDFVVSGRDAVSVYQLEERLLLMAIPKGSGLVGKSLAQSQLADAFGLSVLGVIRKGKTKLMPKPKEKLQAGDQLVVEGRLEDVQILRALQHIQVEDEKGYSLDDLESEEIGLVEAVTSPHSNLANKTLRELKFREKYGLNILAIWRGGRAYRSNLREMPLHHGDSLLIYGDRSRIKMLAEEGQFLVLAQELQEAPKKEKALWAALIMIGVSASVGLGWLPIEIAAVAGAVLMVLMRCLTMEEAQKSIQWPGIFLIAGMLPLGLALQNSGTAVFLGTQAFATAGEWGTAKLLVALFLVSNLSAQFIPPPVVVVLVSSIVMNNAANLAASSPALLLTIAMGAATPFLTPVSHPANLLVMGPGGYRFSDYAKIGLPLTLLIMAVAVVAIPYFWP